jgi:hypothetical protein
LALYPKESGTIEKFAALSTLSGFALSVSYHEPRERFMKAPYNNLYIVTPPINTMDFVYAK